jgi:nitrate/TMAO reductase-like tetraheme cytochrome c subunit
MPLSDNVKGFIIASLVMALFLYGFRYYRHTQADPEFCLSCHPLQETYRVWEKGTHRDVICQKCHEFGIMEQNKRFAAYITSGKQPVSLSHGRVTPWQKCRDCHDEAVNQGAKSPTSTFGHARHVGVKNMQCQACHSGTDHEFKPNDLACIGCHQDREVHGIAVEDFSCLKCHRFSKREMVMTPRALCDTCHHTVPPQGPKAKLSCHYCHKPHSADKPNSATCATECHKNVPALGQHGKHLKQGVACTHCHKPHIWSIRTRAATLCKECHAYRDPRTFKYL